MNVAGTILEDQADADTDLSIKQRLVLAGGSTLAGVGEEVGIEGVSETLEVAGMYRNQECIKKSKRLRHLQLLLCLQCRAAKLAWLNCYD